MVNARRQRDESRTGSILAVIGCLGLLAITFGTGFYSGRLLSRTASAAPAAVVEAEPVARGATEVSIPAARPALTFYEELTAPMPPAAPPAPPKTAAAQPRRGPEKPEAGAVPRAEDKSMRSEKRGTETPGRPGGMQAPASRFTVQIAAYTVRASAEALRSTISAAGHDAYIVENEGPPGTPRYRVRVGSYPTREAAIAAATRLPGAGARYVTSR